MNAVGRTIVALLAACAACGAVDLKIPENIRPMVAMVDGAPPEFGAAALERLLESAKIGDLATRRALTEQAFQLGAIAHDPWPTRAIPGAGYTASMRAYGAGLQLDRLSLQLAAVRLMIDVDKKRARDMFLEIPKPMPPALTCGDWLAPDFGDFYRTLARVIDETFTAEEKHREDDVHLAIDYVTAITSPLQLQPAMRMVMSIQASPEQKHMLLVQLGSMFSAVQAEDRSFTLVSSGLSADLPPELLPSFQRFVAGHTTAEPCKPAARDEATQSADEKRITADQSKLMFNGSVLVSKSERATPKWEQRLDDFLNDLSAWRQGDNEPDSAFYHRRMTVYENLLDVTTGATRARLIDDMIGFAIQSNLLRDAPAEWYFELKNADDHVRGSTASGSDVMEGFKRSGHPVLVLAAAMDHLFGKH